MFAVKKLAIRHPFLSSMLVLAIALVAVSGLGSPVQAQDCGLVCGLCIDKNHREGAVHDGGGAYHMGCVTGNMCRECGDDDEELFFAASSGSTVLSAIQAAVPGDVAKLVAPHADRLLLHEDRNLLAIQGSACQAGRVTAVVFLKRQITLAIRKAGIRRLQDFAEETPSVG